MHTFSPANSDSVGIGTSHLWCEEKRSPSVGVTPIEVLSQIRFRLCHLYLTFLSRHIVPKHRILYIIFAFLSRGAENFEMNTPAESCGAAGGGRLGRGSADRTKFTMFSALRTSPASDASEKASDRTPHVKLVNVLI